MERQQNPHHRRHLSATFSKKFSRVHSFLNRTAYDDVFTAPIRDASREFSPRFADYTEIFNSSKASRASSIPVLDLPPLMDGESIGGVQLDYSSIFGGFDEAKFGVSYEELFPRSMGDNIKDYSDFRSTDGVGSVWKDRDLKSTPPTTYSSNDPQCTTSFNKSSNKTGDKSVIDVVTHITQIYSTPGFTHVNDSTLDPPENKHPSHKYYFDDPFEKDMSHSPKQHKAEVVTENNEKGNTENSKYDFMKPGSSRPESSEDDASQDRFDCCTETFSDEEINIDSAAAASADAVRKAIEVAGERIRLVKESVKKRNGSSMDSKFDFMAGMGEDNKTPESRECQPNRETEAAQESRGETKDVDLCDFPENGDFQDENIGKCETGDEWRRLKQFYQLVNMCKNRAVSLFSDRANNKSFAEDEGGGMPPTVLPVEDTDENSLTFHQAEETSQSPSMNTYRDGMELNESWECAEISEIPAISEQRGEVVGSMEVGSALEHDERKPEALYGDGLGMSSTSCPEDDNGEEILQEKPLVDCWSDSEESFEEDELLERKNFNGSDTDEPFAEMDDSSESIEASFTSDIREMNSESMKEAFGRIDIPQKESNFLKTRVEGCDELIISESSTVEPCIGSDPRYEDGGLFEMESTVSSETEFYGDMMDTMGKEDEVEKETYENAEEDNSSCGSHENIGNVSVMSSDFDELEGVNQESCISDDPNGNVDFDVEHFQNVEKNEVNQIEEVLHHKETMDPTAVEESPSGENAYESDETVSVAGYEEEIVCEPRNLHSMNGEFETSEEIWCDDDTSLLEKSETEETVQRHDKSKGKNEEKTKEESKVVENAMSEARERAYAEARVKAERLAAERRSTECVETINGLIRERLGKVVENSMPEARERTYVEAREKAERLAAERSTECVETINKLIRERLGKDVENSMPEARERTYVEAREKAERLAAERASAEYVETINKLIRERLGKAHTYTKSMPATGDDAKRRSERAAVERATTEARERALQKALSEKTVSERRQQSERQGPGKVATSRGGGTNDERSRGLDTSRSVGASKGNSNLGVKEEFILRNQAKLERHQRTVERVAKALEEKNMRDLLVQKEQAEKNRLADTVGAEVKRWAKGKQGNLRALLSTLQYILGPDSGWQPIPLTDLVTADSVKKAYRKATLFVHPDKLQQRGATVQQKYICEKVFDLLKDAWNRSKGD